MPPRATILVVEDEAVIAADIRASLEELGYHVLKTVSNGDDALRAIAAGAPDLVLMDISIQGEIDGIDTALRIRDRFATPVIYLTSFSDEATLSRAKKAGVYGYLLKPFADRDLRTAIDVALSKRELEVKLADRERWFATTLHSIGDAVIATDTEQRITFMNAIAEEVTGWKVKEAEGRSLAEVFKLVDETTGAPLELPLDRALREGFAIEVPRAKAIARKPGNLRSVDDSAAPIINDKGRVIGGVVVFRDVTERRQLEQRLAQTERLAAIGTLSAGMAHEINNPLAYVLANVEYALEVLPELAAEANGSAVAQITELIEALREAKEGSQRVHRIVHELKKFGRAEAEATKARVLELTDVVDDAIRMTENIVRHHARVRREYRTTPFVAGNAGQLEQVFINLLVNAAQAIGSADGSGTAETNEIVVATFTDESGRAVVEVRDSGPGIPVALQGKIFHPFFTTKAVGEGSGLGLSICHSLIHQHHGEITLTSKPNEGATFRVVLPAASRKDTTRPPRALESAAKLRGRVLIVDDEPAIGRAIARLLQREHDVFVLQDPHEALARVAAGETFDVVFCDLMMPPMTGADLFRAIGELDAELARRIVFVTGGAFTPKAEEFLRSTTNVTLAKPIDPRALTRIVIDYVNRVR